MIGDILLAGLPIGCIYAFVALGFSLIYSSVRLLHRAQGDFIMVGAYIGLLFASAYHFSTVPVLLVSLHPSRRRDYRQGEASSSITVAKGRALRRGAIRSRTCCSDVGQRSKLIPMERLSGGDIKASVKGGGTDTHVGSLLPERAQGTISA